MALFNDSLTEAQRINRLLQAAVEHYPRLAAFSFMLVFPPGVASAGYPALISRFHTEVRQRIREYAQQRQQAHRHSPPTILRWLWEGAGAPTCRMVLLMNRDTPGIVENDTLLQEAGDILAGAWRTATGTEQYSVEGMVLTTTDRTARDAFTVPFSQLKSRVQEMVAPVMMTAWA